MTTLLSLGEAVCREIDAFSPDVVVLLLHGGWVVLKAAREIWRRTRIEEFPIVLPINLGREKIDRYESEADDPTFSHNQFVGICASAVDIGHFLHWVEHQKDWIDYLRDHIKEVCLEPNQLKRILIVDDASFEENTFDSTAKRLTTLLNCEKV